MRQIKVGAVAFIVVLGSVFLARPGVAAVTNPAPNQVFAFGITSMEFDWDPVLGATSYELKILFNEALFCSKVGIAGTTVTLTNTYEPGYYTVFLRDVNGAISGPWSAPATFIVQRNMTPGGNTVFLKAPAIFKWSRSQSATRYQLKLAQYDNTTRKYVVKQNTWIRQPASGSPKWRPAVNSISNGKFRWSITGYSGDNPDYSSTAGFQVKTVSGSDYLVVDLSGGPDAGSYPVTFLSDAPAGGWTDVYKTTKLVMRKIPSGTFTMGSPAEEVGREFDEKPHTVTLTKWFYIGVFEVTQRQWELVMGNRLSYFSNSSHYASRPVERVGNIAIRGEFTLSLWPVSSEVDAASFMGKLRAKTGMAAFDLPTEAQWEYACRAGNATALNSGKNLTSTYQDAKMAKVGRYWHNGGSNYTENGSTSGGTAKVGSYLPNTWGLYDMHGNVFEWCLDWYRPSYPRGASDPRGAVSGSYRVRRGGSWRIDAGYCRSAFRGSNDYPAMLRDDIGFRAAMNLP
jgi:formylglycine-generating enzyme required for sulfatase activity